MKYASLNCVADRATKHFTDALRGNKLTDLRRKKINQWGLTVKESGATIQYVAELERILKFPILVPTITGKLLYEPKYKSRGSPIKISD